MRIGILQPGFLPWLGFFEQVHRSDIFVIYDDVQYDKNGWRNRNKIKTSQGFQWLTVPAKVRFEEKPRIDQVKIDNTAQWRKKHLNSIINSYSKAPFFKDHIEIFEDVFFREWQYLIDIDMVFITKLARALGIQTECIRSSTLGISGRGVERLIAICKRFKADIFYEGAAGRNYIDVKDFEENGIHVEYQDYQHPEYNQLYGSFMPRLSVIDLLFNHGGASLGILAHKSMVNGGST